MWLTGAPLPSPIKAELGPAKTKWNARGRREGAEIPAPASSFLKDKLSKPDLNTRMSVSAVCDSEHGKHAARLGREAAPTPARGQAGLQYEPISEWENQEQGRLWCTHVLPMLGQGTHSQSVRNSGPASPRETEAGLGYTKVSEIK